MDVKKKNIMLTIWLLLPITIVSLLMVWIFWSLDKERLMADAVPIGAGAGDTGNANALGQWLAGRDPDAVSDALAARRAGRAINPSDWPGGIKIRLSSSLLNSYPDSNWVSCLFDEEGIRYVQAFSNTDADLVERTYDQSVLKNSRIFFSPNGLTDSTHQDRSSSTPLYDNDGRELKAISLVPQIPDPNLQVSDPMVIEVRLDSVYEESP